MARFNLVSLLDTLASQDVVLGLFLGCAGLVFMLLGVRIAKVLIVISFGIIGFVLGGSVDAPPSARVAIGFIAAIGLGFVAVYLFRLAVAILAGGWLGVAAAAFLTSWGATQEMILIGGLFVFVAVVSVTFILFQEMIAFVTSLEGTLLFLAGLVVFLSKTPTLFVHFRGLLMTSSLFPAFILLAGTFTGFYLQLGELRKKDAGTSA